MSRRDVPMSVRRLIVEVDLADLNVAEFCRQHGVSRWFFYDLRRRYASEGETVLELGSRAPHRAANRTPDWVEDAIVQERKRLEEGGLDAGPATIRFHLRGRLGSDVPVPSEATIWRVLTRRGFVSPQPGKAPKHAHRSFATERANQRWQVDSTPWRLADGTAVEIIDLEDDCTRVLIRSKAVRTCNTETVFEAFCEGAETWGWPGEFLSDNATEFRHGLAEAVGALGIGASHSRPYHPQTCGKVERLHQTVKKWLAVQPRAQSLIELQDQLDQFTSIYNHSRPHRSLGRRIPAQVFATTPKNGPANKPIGQPTSIHHNKVSGGVCSIGRRYTISVGAIHNGQPATIITTGLACHVFIAGRIIRQLTLNPLRRSQPLYNRRGNPSNLKQPL
jgi:transposase InsO family protein